ncbi:MAG TPA: hypothetical protein VFX16_11940 [Pseudonocardiaceae bacterium]|nr:hypothetical protein [Pseudonocardiaceae bacterium]
MTLSEDTVSSGPARAGATQPSVLHVNDAAFTAERMITEARRRGYTWDFLPKAAPAQDWRGLTGHARKAVIGAAWVARLKLLARRHDIVHVHSASTLAHSRLGAPRYVVHCHGTDVHTALYDSARSGSIIAGLRDAEAVCYATPDLAEHVLPHRPDATYVPIPIDVSDVSIDIPANNRPTVFFASRWSRDKGVAVELEVARGLAALGDKVDIVGIDWGPSAAEAAAIGVRLVPRCDHADFVRLLAGADVVIGQATGNLGVSDLETLAVGSPLLIPVPIPLYADTAPPVLGGSVADTVAAAEALVAGSRPHDADGVRSWVRDRHGVPAAVDIVAKVHRDVLAARR